MSTTVAQPVKPPVIQGNVISLYAQGVSKRQIAKDLGIARATVDNILARYSQDVPNSASRVQQIIPHAYNAVENAVKGGDAKIAMELLKVTDLSESKGTAYHVSGDMHLTQTMQMLPATTARTEAAAKVPPDDMSLSSHTNFSPPVIDVPVLGEAEWCEQEVPDGSDDY